MISPKLLKTPKNVFKDQQTDNKNKELVICLQIFKVKQEQ